jgi:Periplasmic copper-binding protein (NosD)
MHPTRSFTLSCLALVVLIGLGGQAFASTVAVGTNPACQPSLVHFATIQLAVNSVPAGSTIKVCPGNYPEQVSIINKNLTLIGIAFGTSDAAVVVVPAGGLVTNGVTDIFGFPTAAQIFVQNAAVTISHLTVDGANDGLTNCSIDAIGIYYQNSSGTITSNAVRNVLLPTGLQGCQDGLAINVESNIGAPSVTISSNSVRNYDKNGITASGPDNGNPGPNVTVTGNTIIGLGATTVTAQNGIQIGYGATGTVTSNNVVDDIYINPPGCTLCYGASGILIYGSAGVTVTSNTVESTQIGIVPVTESASLTANGTVVKSNHVGGTQNYDAIDLCSDGNIAQLNVIYGSAQSGIHLDDSCSPSTGSSNNVTGNTINEACAGILLGTGTNTNISPNTFMNDTNTTLAGDTCTPLYGPSKKHQSLRPSPYKIKS